MVYSHKTRDIFSFNIKWDAKTISLFVILLALPNLLSIINITTPWGFNIHFFQIAVFIAALIYGPFGGLLSGVIGSAYSAVLMHNPYLVVGNALLGFLVGLFARYGMHTMLAVALAFLIQLLWLIPSDIYLAHLPLAVITGLVIALMVSNIIWAIVAESSVRPLKRIFQIR